MNKTHIHLLITHLPIMGCILGTVVLLYGLVKSSSQTVIAAYIVFVISSIGAAIAYMTGEAAEHTVRKLPGVAKETIEKHQDFAAIALTAISILGLTSLIGIFVNPRNPLFKKKLGIANLIISILCSALAAWTGYLGGQIRHTEINSNVTTQTQRSE